MSGIFLYATGRLAELTTFEWAGWRAARSAELTTKPAAAGERGGGGGTGYSISGDNAMEAIMNKVLYIEGYNTPDAKVVDLLGKGYTVYNAPRPLMGHECWTGDFRHGVFYAAVAPDELDEFGDAPEFHKRNRENDGHPCEVVPREAIMAYGAEVAKKYRIDLAEFEYDDIVQSYLGSLK